MAHERSLTATGPDGDDAQSPVVRLNALAARTRDMVRSLPDDWDFGEIESNDAHGLAVEGGDAVRAVAASWSSDMPYGGHGVEVPGMDLATHSMKAYGRWILDNPVTADLPLDVAIETGPAR